MRVRVSLSYTLLWDLRTITPAVTTSSTMRRKRLSTRGKDSGPTSSPKKGSTWVDSSRSIKHTNVPTNANNIAYMRANIADLGNSRTTQHTTKYSATNYNKFLHHHNTTQREHSLAQQRSRVVRCKRTAMMGPGLKCFLRRSWNCRSPIMDEKMRATK